MQINDINKKWLFEEHGIEDLLDPYQTLMPVQLCWLDTSRNTAKILP